ncbi:MAG: T9SS type A sorting domain-containing protein [Bacteroidota bacterium]
MKTTIVCFLLCCTVALSTAWAQPCFPNGYAPTSQEEVDNFATLYPDCTELANGLYIHSGTSPQLTNLNGLAQLTRVNGPVSIDGMNSLENLQGLHNITYISDFLHISYSNGFVDLSGLEALDSIGGGISFFFSTIDDVSGMEKLTKVGGFIRFDICNINSISGMNNLISIGGNLEYDGAAVPDISGWQNLQTIQGNLDLDFSSLVPFTDQVNTFNQLTFVGGGLIFNNVRSLNDFSNFANLATVGGPIYLFSCPNISSFTGLENLTEIGGRLELFNCIHFESLDGLENVSHIGGKLDIQDCYNLKNISGLSSLKSIDGELTIRTNYDLVSLAGLENLERINGDLSISSNDSIVSIASLQKLSASGVTGLEISFNPLLSDCASFGVCNYLSTNNDAMIINNNFDCMDATEVIDICSGLFSKVRYFTFYDINQNQILDPDEPIYTDAGLLVDPPLLYDYSNGENGGTILLETGNYTLSTLVGPQWTLTTSPADIPIELTEPNTCDSVFFGLFPNEEESLLLTAIQSPPTRCNELITFEVSSKNMGTTIEGGILWLEADPDVLGVNFIDPPDTTVGSDQFGWFFSDLFPSQSISRKISFQIPGPPDFPLGELLNFFSYIEFDGQSWVQEATGFRYQPEVRCSYDPNDKLVNPNREGNYTLFEEFLIYTVRFQNTGNDYARDVVIRDTLDSNLDASTFQILGTSHPNQLSTRLLDDQYLTFDFSNIFLPDSTADFEGSQGYVSYLIKGNEGLAENTPIENTASIYFDFNPPIVTNTTQNIMVSELPTTATQNPLTAYLTVFPNPTTDWIHIRYERGGEVSFRLLNTVGQEVMTGQFEAQSQFSIKRLPAGIYWLHLQTAEGSVSQKIIR